jgi:hypothetical protein
MSINSSRESVHVCIDIDIATHPVNVEDNHLSDDQLGLLYFLQVCEYALRLVIFSFEDPH